MAKLRITVGGLEWTQDDGLHQTSAEVIVNLADKEIVRNEFSGETAGHYARNYKVKSGEDELQVTWETEAPHFECKAEIIETE
jgi:hypothetical protein